MLIETGEEQQPAREPLVVAAQERFDEIALNLTVSGQQMRTK